MIAADLGHQRQTIHDPGQTHIPVTITQISACRASATRASALFRGFQHLQSRILQRGDRGHANEGLILHRDWFCEHRLASHALHWAKRGPSGLPIFVFAVNDLPDVNARDPRMRCVPKELARRSPWRQSLSACLPREPELGYQSPHARICAYEAMRTWGERPPSDLMLAERAMIGWAAGKKGMTGTGS